MSHPTPVTLRPYQEEALQAVEHCLRTGTTRIIISTPTGTGKATMTAQLPQRLGTPLLLLTHREELLDQHERQMRHANPMLRIGIEQRDRYAHSSNDVILASIPTLAAQGGRRLAYLTTIPWKAVVVDEVHHAPAQTWQRVIEALGCLAPQGPPLIGTSATLRRGDGVGLEKLFEKIAYQKSLRDMIDDGWCCDLRAFAVHTDVSLDHVRTHHGDFTEGSLANTVNTPSRNTLIVEAWRRLAESRRTLVFCANVLHAEAVALSFQRAGIEAQSLTGGLNRDERASRLKAFHSGALPVLTNCLDAQTEILTHAGWKNMWTIKDTDLTAAVDSITGEIRWEPILHITRRPIAPNERMVTIRHRYCDLRVTEGHHMLIGTPKGAARRPVWDVVTADALPSRTKPFTLRLCGIAKPDDPAPPQPVIPTKNLAASIRSYSYYLRKRGLEPKTARARAIDRYANLTIPPHELTAAHCEFIGLFLTDGHLDRIRGIQIAQSKRYTHANHEIRRILTNCNFDWKANDMGDYYLYRIPKGTIGGTLSRKGFAPLAPYLTKGNVDRLFACSKDQVYHLLYGAWLGDGSKHGHTHFTTNETNRKGWHIGKPDKALLDRLQALCLLRGFTAKVRGPFDNGPLATQPMYFLSVSWRPIITLNTRGHGKPNPAVFEDPRPGELVWCVTNLTHIVITRRNGRPTVTGQCNILSEGYDDPPLSCLILARPTKSALLFEQMLGRVTRIFEGKTDGLILDVVDVSRAHRLQTVASLFGLPAAMNLKGRSVTKTADQVEAVLSRHPQLQPELFASVNQLLAEAERIALDIRPVDLIPHLAPEVMSEATLAWIRLPSQEYAMPLAGRTQIRIRLNLLDQWETVVFPEHAVLNVHPSRREAFAAAEREIATRDPQRWQLAHHQAAWRREPPSEAQQALLRTLKVMPPATRGEASQLIDQLRAQRQTGALAQPATSRQRWFLVRHGAWRDAMSRGEAGVAINEIKQRETNDITRRNGESSDHAISSEA